MKLYNAAFLKISWFWTIQMRIPETWMVRSLCYKVVVSKFGYNEHDHIEALNVQLCYTKIAFLIKLFTI